MTRPSDNCREQGFALSISECDDSRITGAKRIYRQCLGLQFHALSGLVNWLGAKIWSDKCP
jgi:hypothetical protein